MQHRFRCIWLAATVLATALGGVATPASAAIRVVISDGSNSQVFYSSDDAASFFSTTLGTYDFVAGATLTNFSNQSESGASLTTAFLFGDSLPSGTLPTLRVTSSVIDAVAGVANGQVTGGDQTLVLGASLARFTQPGTPELMVTSDVQSSATSMAGTVQNNSSVNGSLVASLAIPVDAVNPPEAQQAGVVGNTPGLGFTLVSEIVVSGVASGIVGSLSATTTVNALTPEPGPLVLWGLGALGIVATAACGRYRRLASH